VSKQSADKASTNKSDETSVDFEQALTRLEELVERMEEGDMSLEASLQAFEDGVRLTRQCQQALGAAEQRVQILLEKDGKIETEPFTDDCMDAGGRAKQDARADDFMDAGGRAKQDASAG
jgi:exodeoxyribonuclease VII small subunit